MKTNFKVFRHNPHEGAHPHYDTFTFDIADSATVLDGLHKIQETIDGSLAFRRSCRASICGSCATMVNGFAKLTCKTQIKNVMTEDGTVKLDPLRNFKPIKDLVVDLQPFWDKIEKIKPWLMPKEENVDTKKEFTQTKEEHSKFRDVVNCILCAICYADCTAIPTMPSFLGPTALAKAYRFVGDSRDKAIKERLKELSEDTLWLCDHCYACTSCPKYISPAKTISILRGEAVSSGITEGRGPRHLEAVVDSIKRCGMLDEAWVPIGSIGFDPLALMLEILPQGIKMALKGKLPMPIARPIDGINEVHDLFAEFEEKK